MKRADYSARSPFHAFAAFAAAAIAVLGLALVSGCASERIVLRPAATNTVAILATNTAPQVTQTQVVRTELNPIPGGPELRTTNFLTVTNYVSQIETNFVRVISPEVAYTNVSLAPAVTAGVQVAGAVAPVPWASAAAGIFGTLTAGIFAFINDRRRKAALGEASTWQETAGVLVDNIEAIRKDVLKVPGYTTAMDAKVVRGLELAQAAAGVKPQIASLVEARTDYTHAV